MALTQSQPYNWRLQSDPVLNVDGTPSAATLEAFFRSDVKDGADVIAQPQSQSVIIDFVTDAAKTVNGRTYGQIYADLLAAINQEFAAAQEAQP